MDYSGHIDDTGKLILLNQFELKEWLKKNAGKDIALSIEVKKKKRTNPQNAYYWGVIIPMIRNGMNSFGNEFTTEETHEFLKKQFNSKEIELIDGHYIDMPLSTTKLSTEEFNIFKERIQEFAISMLNIYIPDPGEATEFIF